MRMLNGSLLLPKLTNEALAIVDPINFRLWTRPRAFDDPATTGLHNKDSQPANRTIDKRDQIGTAGFGLQTLNNKGNG